MSDHLELLALTLDDNEIVRYVGQNDTPEIRAVLLVSPKLQRLYCLRVCYSCMIVNKQDFGSITYTSNDSCILNKDYKCEQGVMVHKVSGENLLESIRLAEEKNEGVQVKND